MPGIHIRVVCVIFYLCSGFLVAQKPASSSSPDNGVKIAPGAGSISNGAYRNRYFQFSYQLPFGWVDRTTEMREDTETAKSRILLAIFERPPAATGKTINSAVVIAAESVTSYPGLHSVADYFGLLTELVTSKGFKAVNDPYEFPIDGQPIARRDFTKQIAGLTMYQSSLVMLSRGYVLSFTLIGGSDDDIVQLVEKLSFAKKH